VHCRHLVAALGESRGHVEHAPAPDRWELRAVADERDRRTVLIQHRQQGKGGVLLEHPGLVHHEGIYIDVLDYSGGKPYWLSAGLPLIATEQAA
jgi:hypothetical protein